MPRVRLALGILALSVFSLAPPAAADWDDARVKKVEELLPSLCGDDASARDKAADELAGLYPEAAAAVPVLVQMLGDDNEAVARTASETLRLLGSQAIRRLTGRLVSPGEVLEKKLERVAAMGPHLRIFDLVPRDAEDPEARKAFAICLGLSAGIPDLGTAVPYLMPPLLRDPVEEVRHSTALAWLLIGSRARRTGIGVPESPDVTKALRFSLASADAEKRFALARALAYHRPGGMVEALAKALREEPVEESSGKDAPHRAVREAICDALAGLGEAAREAVPSLLGALDHGALPAARALVELGETDAVTERLKSEVNAVRWCAAVALSEAGGPAEAVVPVLLEDLGSEERGYTEAMRLEAVRALCRYGPAAAAAAPGLAELLARRIPNLTGAVAVAIHRIAPDHPKGMPLILKMLEEGRSSKPPFAVWAFAGAFAEAGVLPKEAAPKMIEALGVLPPGWVPTSFPALLAGCGQDPAVVVPALLNLMGGLDDAEKAAAGSDFAKTLNVLVKEGSELRVPELRWEAIKALESMGVGAKAAVPALKELAESGDAASRYLARRALRRFGEGR